MKSQAFVVVGITFKLGRKPSAEMPAPSRLLALTTGVLDRVFIFVSLGCALLFLLRGYPDIFLPFSGHFDFPLQLLGMALLVVSMFESWWAIASMGEFNQPRWEHLKQGHTVVKTGAYRYLRHPQYASKMLAFATTREPRRHSCGFRQPLSGNSPCLSHSSIT